MLRPKVVIPPVSKRAVAVIEHTLRTILSMVILGVIYRYCWIGTYSKAHSIHNDCECYVDIIPDNSDPYKCSALLNRGSWLDPARLWNTQNAFQHWQPPGCLMHEYKKRDIQNCFRERRLLFVGDSTIRQIFWAVAKKMDQRKADEDMAEMLDLEHKHEDIEFISGGVKVQFIWDPWLNSTGLQRELKKFNANPSPNSVDTSAGLILAGAPGLWYARHGKENYFRDFRDSIEEIIPYMDHSTNAKSTRPKSFSAREQLPNFLLLAPVQVPRYQLLSKSRMNKITPTKIDQMNNFLQQVSAHSKADVVWSYSAMTINGRAEYDDTGIHVVENVALRKADILLNLRCNGDSSNKSYPFNKTCCSNYTKPGGVQWVILLLSFVGFPALMLVQRRYLWKVRRLFPPPDVVKAFVIIALTICICFYADRTQVFEKAHKQVRSDAFLWSMFATLIIAFVSIRKSTPTRTYPPKPTEDGFLSRDQTDEWKGWMQAFILVYHYTHSSQTLWIYEIVRLLVASYLFMTGYGHTLYFLRRKDYSLKRAAAVLLRLNLLSCILPYMMRTTYHFYYFAPLVTFWFSIIYFTLKIGRERNSEFLFFCRKLVLSAVCTTTFTRMPGILESLSLMLRYTCAISLDVREWRFRTFLDMYVVYVGMLFAALYHQSTRPTTPSQNIETLLRWRSNPSFKVAAVITALYMIPGFCAFAQRSTRKEEYNLWNPYLSCIPIIAYVMLRNSHPVLRNYHSAGMAWLGRCSLETYVLQYHIWLAGDATGLLRTGVFSTSVDVVVLSLILLWLAWCMAGATGVVTGWVIDNHRMEMGAKGEMALELGEREKGSPYLLPSSSRGWEDGRPSKYLRFEVGSSSVLGKLGESLKLRLGVILFVMWIANVCYR